MSVGVFGMVCYFFEEVLGFVVRKIFNLVCLCFVLVNIFFWKILVVYFVWMLLFIYNYNVMKMLYIEYSNFLCI